MHVVLIIAVAVTGVAAAVRSTWSPCGLSMMSSITPLGESGRGVRYRVTAAWFIAGAVLGGLCLGGVAAALAIAVRVWSPAPTAVLALGGGLAAVATAADLGWLGFRLPLFRRQVNERWLDHYRAWVYGAGFGWQIGAGVTTYVMTAAVILLVPLAALTGSPWWAAAAGALFGAIRGAAVLATRRVDSMSDLRALHQRFERGREPVRRGVIGVELIVGAALLGLAWWPLGVGGAVIMVAAATRRLGGGDRLVTDEHTVVTNGSALVTSEHTAGLYGAEELAH
jgi:hypothetical protein